MPRLFNLKAEHAAILAIICIFAFFINISAAEKILDHKVVLDSQGRLLPWTSNNNIIRWSLNFIKDCPTLQTKFGQDPWYLITGKFTVEGKMFDKITKQKNMEGVAK